MKLGSDRWAELAAPRRWEFHVLMDLLSRLHREEVVDSVAPGAAGRLDREAVRLRAARSLGHPAREIVEVSEGRHLDGTPRFEVEIAFLGLYGPSSPFEASFTADLVQDQHGDRVASFLDIINHRAASILYQGIVSARWWMGGPDAAAGTPDVGWRPWLTALGGAAVGALPPALVARTAGLWHHQPRGLDGLERVLGLWLAGLPVEVEVGVARWVRAAKGLGAAALGRGLLLGGRTRSAASSFRVTIGPLNPEQLSQLQSAGGAAAVESLLAAWCDGPQAFEIEVLVTSLPGARLAAPPGSGSRLGRDAILGAVRSDGPPRRAASDLRP